MSNQRLQFYIDSLIVETFLSDGMIVKTAEGGSLIDSLIAWVKGYVSDKIVKGHEAESVINILGPGILFATGFPILATLFEFSEVFLGFNPGKILMSIVNSIKPMLFPGSKIDPAHVDAAAAQAAQADISATTEADVDKLTKGATLRDAQLLKIAMLHTLAIKEKNIPELEKRAQIASALLQLVGLKSKTSSILGRVIGWIVKVVLASAGFMVLGSILEKGKEMVMGPSAPKSSNLVSSTQTLFKVNPGYTEEKMNVNNGWIETVPPDQIGNQVVQWATNIYPDLKGKDNFIRSSQAFNATIKEIQDYNSTNTSGITFMPKMFSSRKKVVDMFIDDLADRAQKTNLIPNAPVPNKPSDPNALPKGYIRT